MNKQLSLVIYFDKFSVIDPQIIKQLDNQNVFLDKFNKLHYTINNTKKGKNEFIKFCRMFEENHNIKIIGMGEYDNEGKISIYVIYRKDIITILSKEIEIIMHELGINIDGISEVSNVVAFEILKNIAIKRNLDMNLYFQYTSKTFSYVFVINENLRKKIISEYIKNMNEYVSNVSCNNSLLNKLRQIINLNKKDLAIVIISGIVVEACMKIMVYFLSTPHLDEGKRKLSDLNLPEKIYDFITSKKGFTIEDVKNVVQMSELDLILLFNSLIEAEIIEVNYKRIYKGTGNLTIPNVMGKSVFVDEKIADRSSLFMKYNEPFIAQMHSGITDLNSDWTPSEDVQDILDDLYYYTSSKNSSDSEDIPPS